MGGMEGAGWFGSEGGRMGVCNDCCGLVPVGWGTAYPLDAKPVAGVFPAKGTVGTTPGAGGAGGAEEAEGPDAKTVEAVAEGGAALIAAWAFDGSKYVGI